LLSEIFAGLGGEAGRGLPELLREIGIEEPRIDAHVIALQPGHPYLRLPLQFSVALESRLLETLSEDELASLRREAEDDSGIEVAVAAARRRCSARECGGEQLCPDDDVPRLDARDHEPVRVHPGVVGEASADLVFGLGIDDQQDAQAPALRPGERPCEQDKSLVGECVHERGVLVHGWLTGDPSVRPARTRFPDDGEVSHLGRAIR